MYDVVVPLTVRNLTAVDSRHGSGAIGLVGSGPAHGRPPFVIAAGRPGSWLGEFGNASVAFFGSGISGCRRPSRRA